MMSQDKSSYFSTSLSSESDAFRNQVTTIEEKDISCKADELFLKIKSHFNNLKEDLAVQNLNFNDCSEIPMILSLCLNKDFKTFEGQNQDIKEIKRKNLQVAEISLQVIYFYLENAETTEAKKSIVHVSLQSLHKAYTHCKDSEAYYGEFFEEFTEELGNFYKLVQEVQKVTFKCLDDLIDTDSYDADSGRKEIVLVSCDVGQLCELILSLDRMISLTFWKMFIKLVYKYKNIAQKKINVDPFLVALILDIQDIIQQCACCIEAKEQIEEPDVKMCIIELSTLKKIVDVFQGYLKQKAINHLRDLALHLYNLLIMSYSNSVVEDKDLNMIKILLRNAKSVITYFFCDNMFFESTFHCSSEEISGDLQLPLVLLKLSTLEYLKTIDSKSLQKMEALKEIFETLKYNKPEDDLQLLSLKIMETPSKVAGNENTELNSLFHFCYTCLTEYCKHILSNNVTEVFERWLPSYTSSSDIVCLLISDVWIYYLRSGSYDNVYKNCKFLSKAIGRSDLKPRIELLLIRMLQYLPSDYKIRLFEEEIYLKQILCKGNFMPSSVKVLPADLKSSERIKMILENLEMLTLDDTEALTQKACFILELGTLSMDKLTPAELLKILEYSNTLLKSNVFDIQMAILQLIRTLRGRILSKNERELDALTSVIAELLCELMNCKNYIIKYDAFDVYFNLAETTPHTEILKKVVIKCPRLTPLIKSFAEKVPPGGFLKEETKQKLFQKQLLCHQKRKQTLKLVTADEKSVLSKLVK